MEERRGRSICPSGPSEAVRRSSGDGDEGGGGGHGRHRQRRRALGVAGLWSWVQRSESLASINREVWEKGRGRRRDRNPWKPVEETTRVRSDAGPPCDLRFSGWFA